LKQLQDAVGNILEQIGIENDFLNRTQKAQHLKRNNEQMRLHQTKKLLDRKGNSHQSQETAHRMGEKSLPATHPIRDKYPESTGNSKNLAPKESTPQ
jgi:hypothetical protein